MNPIDKMYGRSALFRIAYCLPGLKASDSRDTSFLQQLLIATRLRARGHTLTYIAPNDLENVLCTDELDLPRIAKRTWSAAEWFRLARKVTWQVQKIFGVPYLNVFSNYCLYDACMRCLPGHDIVQERNGLYNMGVAMACRRLNLPYIMFFDADDILEYDLFEKPLTGLLRMRAKQAIRYNLATAVRVICVSTQAKSHLIRAWNVPEGKIAVFPNGVDVNQFGPNPEARGKVRAHFGIDEHPMVIFVGSFFPYQDVRVLIDAFSRLLHTVPQAHLVLVGEGEQYNDMIQYANSMGLSSNVSFTGFLPHAEIPRLISASDIAVAPYKNIAQERFLISPMKLFEYMASGTASVASDIGQISDVIQNGHNGLLVPPSNADMLAEALNTLITHPQLRLELGRQSRDDVIGKYSWESYVSRLENMYMTVIGEWGKKKSRKGE